MRAIHWELYSAKLGFHFNVSNEQLARAKTGKVSTQFTQNFPTSKWKQIKLKFLHAKWLD